MIILILILLIVFLAFAVVGFCFFRRIRSKARQYSKMLFGTPSLAEGFRNLEALDLATPKSVSSATSLYLPAIMKDFPEFHYDEMKSRAESLLVSYLQSVDRRNPGLLTEGTEELKSRLEQQIQMLENLGHREYFREIKIHRTEIFQYRKEKGRRSIVFQSAVEAIHYLEQDGKLSEGRRDLPEQSKYNVELVYIQDRELVKKLGDAGLALNCPNCGAPLMQVGAKKCAYCDSPVVAFNLRVWNFNRVTQV